MVAKNYYGETKFANLFNGGSNLQRPRYKGPSDSAKKAQAKRIAQAKARKKYRKRPVARRGACSCCVAPPVCCCRGGRRAPVRRRRRKPAKKARKKVVKLAPGQGPPRQSATVRAMAMARDRKVGVPENQEEPTGDAQGSYVEKAARVAAYIANVRDAYRRVRKEKRPRDYGSTEDEYRINQVRLELDEFD